MHQAYQRAERLRENYERARAAVDDAPPRGLPSGRDGQ
eukprot:CAMPEP_0195055634 /NCGR_PEP_ID=MMETSP0448-20130528/4266_1 /TAXON_ID=66468 /ORGANISM="Heterocapsa triquestra, Strain CCMP 448" /LENGTH=37 /DNA_ID= /DNA_START= /DNA_END= /DNA_ORIENTATION=